MTERYFIIGDYNTFFDWKLILTSKTITPPEANTKYVSIDGMDGTLDLSESLTGGITYKDRTISATFWTDNGSYSDRERLFQKIVSAVHGKKVKIIDPDDPDHYFLGRISISNSNNNLAYMSFSLSAICDPWRYSNVETVRSLSVSDWITTREVIHNDGVKTVCPSIIIVGTVGITINGVTTQLTAGTYRITDLKLPQGATVIDVSGPGIITLKYREADL